MRHIGAPHQSRVSARIRNVSAELLVKGTLSYTGEFCAGGQACSGRMSVHRRSPPTSWMVFRDDPFSAWCLPPPAAQLAQTLFKIFFSSTCVRDPKGMAVKKNHGPLGRGKRAPHRLYGRPAARPWEESAARACLNNTSRRTQRARCHAVLKRQHYLVGPTDSVNDGRVCIAWLAGGQWSAVGESATVG